ncbi:MAG: putative baseplate assembly protein [bacterium]|nr:putative baseplate assembly protein [bacterium]
MAAPPQLDDRTFQDILRQLRDAAAQDVPLWTPPTGGDAGTMLQRVFARLMEIALARLNRVGEKNLMAFLDTMGIDLLAPSPATAPLTFSLTPGTPATRVPAGTRAGTPPKGGQSPVIFETSEDLTVIPARLVAARTVDPVWDRHADHTPALAGQSRHGFTPFGGGRRLPHVLSLGDPVLLDCADATVEVDFTPRGENPPGPEMLKALLRRLVWTVTRDGRTQTLLPVPDEAIEPPWIRLLGVGPDETEVRGVSADDAPKAGMPGRWLHASVPVPLPDWPAARDLQPSDLSLRVQESGLAPDFAFGNTEPLDVSRDFLPFGEEPKAGDVLYLGSRLAFAKAGAEVRMTCEMADVLPPALVWEYWYFDQSADGLVEAHWREIPSADVADGTNGFTESSTISLTGLIDMKHTFVDGISGFWVRARIDGSYREAPRVHALGLASHLASLSADVDIDDDEVSLAPPFVPAEGDVLRIGSEIVQVVNAGVVSVEVAPPFLAAHPAGTSVESGWSAELIGAVDQPAPPGALSIHVFLQEPVSPVRPGDVWRLGSASNSPEFVTVDRVIWEAIPVATIELSEPLRFDHSPIQGAVDVSHTNVSRVDRPMNAFGPDEHPRVGEAFSPFGAEPSPGSVLYLGSPAQWPQNADLVVDLEMVTPDVELTWEFLGADGWRDFSPTADDTGHFGHAGDVVFTVPPAVPAEVNAQHSHWIRARISHGGYGRAVELEPAEANNPAAGFRAKPGTGNLNPPVITRLALAYDAQGAPAVVSRNGFVYRDHTTASAGGEAFDPFVPVSELTPAIHADPEPALYLAFDAASAEQPVTLYLAAAARAAGRVLQGARPAASDTPHLTWEYFDGTSWRELAVIDGSSHGTESGTLTFLTPADMAPVARFDPTPRHWIRARAAASDPADPRRWHGIFLNTIPALQAETVSAENLGSGNGQAGQTLRFGRAPVLPGQGVAVREPEPPSEIERAATEAEEGPDAVKELPSATAGETETWVRWHEVTNFLRSTPRSRHYTLDHTTGVLTFGDGIRGLVPPRGSDNLRATYRTGGGEAGNVGTGTVVKLLASVPGVAAVSNPLAAGDGAEVETPEEVRERGPRELRHRRRAVSRADFEALAMRAVGTRVARAKCLPNTDRELRFEPGSVTLIIVPRGAGPRLVPGTELVRRVEDYVQERAFAGLAQPTRINVIGPGYVRVGVAAEVVPNDLREARAVKERALAALDAFFHPLSGGPRGTGWVFGRDVYDSEICQLLEGVAGVGHVEALRLVGDAVQNRLTLEPGAPAAMELPAGSDLRTADGRKAATLAEPVAGGAAVERAACLGFREGDRVTAAQDFTVVGTGESLEVEARGGLSVPCPRGSVVMTLDGSRGSRLAAAVLPGDGGETVELTVEDPDFAASLDPDDVLSVLYPFPMTVTSVTADAEGPLLGAEVHDLELELPAGALVATLDNRVRAPLADGVPAGPASTVLRLQDFDDGEEAVLARRDRLSDLNAATILGVERIVNVVYLGDTSLPYPGTHHITITAGAARR